MLIPQVLGDLAEPDGDLAPAVEPVDGPHRLVKGLLGQFLRQVGVMALGEEKFVDRLGVLAVNGVHIFHKRSLLPGVFISYIPFRPGSLQPVKKILKKRSP